MGVLQNLQKFRVRVWKSYKTSRSSGYGYEVVQNFHKFRPGTTHSVRVPRVLWHGSYRTHRSSGCGYGSLIYACPELLEVLYDRTSRTAGYGYEVVQYFQKFRAGINMLYPYSGSLWRRRTELPEVPGTGISVPQKLPGTEVLGTG